MTEQEFGKSFLDFIKQTGFEYWNEVYIRGKSVDSVVKIGDKYISFELKLSLNDSVLMQARENLLFSNYSYAVIPYERIKNYGDKKYISFVKQYFMLNIGLGLIILDPIKHQVNWKHILFGESIETNYCIEHRFEGKFQDIKNQYYIKNYLFDDQKGSIPGSTSGGVMTPFKRSCNLIIKYLEENEWVKTKKEIWKALEEDLHWRTYNGFCTCFRNYPDIEVLKTIDQILIDRN